MLLSKILEKNKLWLCLSVLKFSLRGTYTVSVVTSSMLTGLSSIRATSKAALPCPSITAVSELRSGFNYNRQKFILL